MLYLWKGFIWTLKGGSYVEKGAAHKCDRDSKLFGVGRVHNQRFIKGFSRTAYPMTQLTCKGVKFKWIRECEKSFQDLKRRLTSTLMLAILKGLEGFVVYVCKERNRMKRSRDTPSLIKCEYL